MGAGGDWPTAPCGGRPTGFRRVVQIVFPILLLALGMFVSLFAVGMFLPLISLVQGLTLAVE